MSTETSSRTATAEPTTARKIHIGFLLLLLLWCLLLLIGVFASSVVALMHLSSLSFHLDPRPHWSQFFAMDFYAHLNNRGWIITKAGHFVGFGILDLLITLSFRRPNLSPFLAFLFAVTTELLQIPFGRDGRLYDVYIDTMGIAVFGFFGTLWPTRDSKNTT
ncbi:VanZ family protein [Alicyclobacillus ferrooxydans]|uniref:VanZ-like domain-containing protein n=1 Tax=Alicyclobacillus ferrooxydans TaxID=471514 RepID=A0A0N8PMP6_9BACL|nr:VanZ family protein [Alicyclobacillus ferrooxydans]KPV39309.1 hypothetical protein AN477_22690 [Alicyclobacillus ferrooxydans]